MTIVVPVESTIWNHINSPDNGAVHWLVVMSLHRVPFSRGNWNPHHTPKNLKRLRLRPGIVLASSLHQKTPFASGPLRYLACTPLEVPTPPAPVEVTVSSTSTDAKGGAHGDPSSGLQVFWLVGILRSCSAALVGGDDGHGSPGRDPFKSATSTCTIGSRHDALFPLSIIHALLPVHTTLNF